MSNDRTTKNDILITLLKRDSETDLSDIVGQAKRMFNDLHNEYGELMDLSSGPQDVDLNQALDKVGFELKNDRTLAGQIRQHFASVTYDRLMKRLKIEDPRVDESTEIAKLADTLAKEMIDTFISIAEFRNKET